MTEATALPKQVNTAHFICKNNNEGRSVTAILITNNRWFITETKITLCVSGEQSTPGTGIFSVTPLDFHFAPEVQNKCHNILVFPRVFYCIAVIQNNWNSPQDSPLSQPTPIQKGFWHKKLIK